MKKGVLRNFTKFTGKHLCQSFFFNKVPGLNFIEKDTLAQVFSCEFCEISKNNFFYRTPPVAASDNCSMMEVKGYCKRNVTRVTMMCHYLRIKHELVVILELAKRKLSMCHNEACDIMLVFNI